VLTNAATLGKVDYLHGFKENVIMGHLIPGGTGFYMHKNITLVPLAEPIPKEDLEETVVEPESAAQQLLR
jgi:DNA-directed RNA polymerase subunit beta'